MDSELPNMLAHELGEISRWEKECPGVYYLNILPESDDAMFYTEYYLVLDNAPISKEAREYGTPLKNRQGLVFSLEQEGSGAKIIEYEIYRYRVAHDLPLPEGEKPARLCGLCCRELPRIFRDATSARADPVGLYDTVP